MRLVAEFGSPEEYLAAYEEEISVGGLFLKGASVEGGAAMSECTLAVLIGGEEVAEENAKLAFVTPGIGVAVVFLAPPAALDELAARLREPRTPMAIALRLLPRVPLNDLRAIAKGAGRQQIVLAARKLLAAR